MSQTTSRRFTQTSFSWRNGCNLSSKYSLNFLCSVCPYILTRTRSSTTIRSTVGFVSWVLHPSYRLSSKPALSQDRTFSFLLKEGGTEVFSWEKSYPCHKFCTGLLHTNEEKSFTFSFKIEMSDEYFDCNGGI